MSAARTRIRAIAIIGSLLVACGDDPPPIEVSAGRLVARIYAEPAGIALALDGKEVWTTRRGDTSAPYGFAATGSIDASVEMQFGSFRFTESDPQWHGIDRLGAITETATGATFTLHSSEGDVGTGTLTFVTATKSGADPDAAGFPRHVKITLEATTGQRISLATPCRADEHLVGLGGQSFDVDHRGQTVPLWVQEDGLGKAPDADDNYDGVWFLSGRRHSTHTPMPMVLSSRGYALAVDTNARATFALCSEREDTMRLESWDTKLDLQVFVGDGPHPAGGDGAAARDALGHMIAWAGKPDARPPLHTFVPWVDAIFGPANVRRIAQKLRASGISAAAIWTEDWRGGDDTQATGYALKENWHVDRALYPDFEQLADELHAQGFAFLTYHNTFLDETADVYAEATAAGYAIHDATGATQTFVGVKFNKSTMLDLSNPAAVTWAKGVMGEGVTLGADGWMADFAEWLPTDAVLASGESALAVHNRYPVDWARFNHELLATTPPGRPAPIYFMRSAWLHSQPLVQVLWPGDQQTDWTDGDGLPSVIPMGIGLGLTGFPYFGSDVAGYMSQGTTPTDEELFYRWTTFGALQPVMRTHHGRSARDNFQWEHDAASIAHFRRWTRLHTQLAAYHWGSIGSFERDGLPLFRLVALEYPDEPWAWTTLDEYLLGDRILVAPVQIQGAAARTVQLPAGVWFPLLGGAALAGGDHEIAAAKTEIPAFVPAGSLLVLYPDGVDTTLPAATGIVVASDDREVWVWPGTALVPAHATWHDELGPIGAAQWSWAERPADAAVPASATFKGAATPVTTGTGFVTATVIGDGTVEFAGGGKLTIARGKPAATTIVRLYSGR